MGIFHVSQKQLAQLCRRVGSSLEAGIDSRKIWQREATARSSPGLQSRLDQIYNGIARGDSLSDALQATGDYFPSLLHEMVAVGEETGKLPEIFKHLADHYDHQLQLRRAFLASIAWPVLQLSAAIAIVGLLIWVLGFLPRGLDGEPPDVLGLGLVGFKGLMVYLFLVGCIALVVAALVVAFRRGLAWVGPLQKALLAVPILGRCLETLCLSRMAWSLHLTLETAMDLPRALALSLKSTRNARYSDQIPRIANYVLEGNEIHEALAATRAYPREFIDALEVGERSGKLPETMGILARQYQDQARRAMAVLTMLAGFLVWALVAAMIIFMIIRLFMTMYLGPIQDALKG